jgi:hypothetical protein
MLNPGQQNLLIVDEALIQQLAADQRFAAAFPFLRSMQQIRQKPRTGCRRCRGSNIQVATTFNAIKSTLAHMGGDKKNLLKQMLNARKVRIVYLQPNGGVVSLTF